ncbi:putative cyclin-D6-1 isoform X2 [Hibiscus syriacus]|uniref:putative cyclin-D6-1 isoform X2 n=1 Tax=Hibiscus syriacus TaxID=106335 RepID=UPI0019248D3A|nr:putative cyclin-D6-1 isoform X2 [Hibiscus syriacus]
MENFDLEDPLKSLEEHQSDTVPALFSSESDHMPSHNYLHCLKTSDSHVSFRQEAISLILQAQYSCNLDPYTQYLAINYMDRFISWQGIPQGNLWVVRLLVIACISLAVKMKEIHFSFSDFQREERFIFDPPAIQRMELLVLDALNWRMRSITPFSFITFYVSLFELKDPPLSQALKDRATNIIFQARNEISLLEFKPSITAASALLLACHELFPLQFPSFETSILSCEYVNKEMVLKCFDAMQEMVNNEVSESMVDVVTSSSTRTPISVLDCHCNKSESESTINSTAAATVTPENREIKRRKLNGFCRESNMMNISQIQPCE